MQTFKFYTNPDDKSNNISEVKELTSYAWDFSSSFQSKKFSDLYRRYLLSLTKPDELRHRVLTATLGNFDLLRTFTEDNPVHHSIANRDCVIEFDNTVAYVDRKKSKTIIALGGGSWYKTLYDYRGLDHVSSWMYDEADAIDYNIISFREKIERCYANPVLYDSCYYDGCNSELSDIQSMADYIKQKFPDSDYYVFGDCKIGHSTALLSYYLNAKRVFIASGITTVDPETLDTYLNKNSSGEYYLNDYQSLGAFEVLLRSVYFSDKIPVDLRTTQSIISKMPDTKFKFYYHSNDIPEFIEQSKLIQESDNVSVEYTDNQKYTHGNHHIIAYLRKFNIVYNFFNESDRSNVSSVVSWRSNWNVPVNN